MLPTLYVELLCARLFQEVSESAQLSEWKWSLILLWLFLMSQLQAWTLLGHFRWLSFSKRLLDKERQWLQAFTHLTLKALCCLTSLCCLQMEIWYIKETRSWVMNTSVLLALSVHCTQIQQTTTWKRLLLTNNKISHSSFYWKPTPQESFHMLSLKTWTHSFSLLPYYYKNLFEILRSKPSFMN